MTNLRELMTGSVAVPSQSAAAGFRGTAPRSGIQLLSPAQQNLLRRIAKAGTLSHAKISSATSSVLLGRGYILPADSGRGVCLTTEGEQIYQDLLRIYLQNPGR